MQMLLVIGKRIVTVRNYLLWNDCVRLFKDLGL
jgi:hypothetical protein